MDPSNPEKLVEGKEELKSCCKKIQWKIMQKKEFHSLSRLPIELRLQIWELALPAPLVYIHSKEDIWYEVSLSQ